GAGRLARRSGRALAALLAPLPRAHGRSRAPGRCAAVPGLARAGPGQSAMVPGHRRRCARGAPRPGRRRAGRGLPRSAGGGGDVLVSGAVIWLTGRPASRKSTLAARVRDRLARDGVPVCVLDGDEVRDALVPRPGYEPAARSAFYATLA